MNNQIHNIIEEWIGENKKKHPSNSQVYDDMNWAVQGYNQALKDLRSRIPELEDSIQNVIGIIR